MKDIANIDYVAGEIEISEGEELSRSADSLKIIVSNVDDEQVDDGITPANRAVSNSNLNDAKADAQTKSNGSIDSRSQSEFSIAIPQTMVMKKKNRLISVDSGFGSYGRCELFSSSIDSVATITTIPQHTSVHTKPIFNANVSDCAENMVEIDGDHNSIATESEKRDEIAPLASETKAKTTNAATGTGTEVTKFVQRYEKIDNYPKNHRNTTLNSIDDTNNFELDARLINRNDGFREVQCYIDEHGSPKVREKHSRPNRKKSTLKQELKARSLGASYDDNLLRKINANKTPSCVSFTRLFKKFRETFCKFDFTRSLLFLLLANLIRETISFSRFSRTKSTFMNSKQLFFCHFAPFCFIINQPTKRSKNE